MTRSTTSTTSKTTVAEQRLRMFSMAMMACVCWMWWIPQRYQACEALSPVTDHRHQGQRQHRQQPNQPQSRLHRNVLDSQSSIFRRWLVLPRRMSTESSQEQQQQKQQQQQQQSDHHHGQVHRRMGELTEPEQTVFDMLREIHESGFPFRVVVVGKGAIVETTHRLGPVIKILQSPSTGANLCTIASEDQSFELHVQLSEVSKIVLAIKETPARTIRVIRMLNGTGEAMCSLILSPDKNKPDVEAAAVHWYDTWSALRGNTIQL